MHICVSKPVPLAAKNFKNKWRWERIREWSKEWRMMKREGGEGKKEEEEEEKEK